jgi:hypothetical protein
MLAYAVFHLSLTLKLVVLENRVSIGDASAVDAKVIVGLVK